MIWVYTDQDRIMGLNNNNMAGNDGWQQAEIELDINAQLFDEKGAALYKLVNGQKVLRTEEERAADWQPDPEPSEEAQLAEAARILFGEAE